MPFTIYKITNTVDGKVYVGQTSMSLAQRWNGHKKWARTLSPLPIYQAMKAFGFDSFTIEPLETMIATREAADAAENRWIVELGSHKEDVGYNRTLGGVGLKNALPETRKKQAESLKKTWQDPEFRERMLPSTFGHGRNVPHQRFDVSTDKIVELYKAGFSTRQVAALVGLSGGGVCRRLKKAGVPFRSKSESQLVWRPL